MTATLTEGVTMMRLPDHLPPPGPDGKWGLREIARAAGVTDAAVYKWRNLYLHDRRANRPLGPSSLVPEDTEGEPRWSPERVIHWLQQTGRMDADMRPTVRGSRKPDNNN